MAMTFGYVESTGGVRIFYACERGMGTPLLIISRIAASTVMQFAANQAFNRELALGGSWFTYDRRDTGRSTKTGLAPTFDEMVDDVVAIAERIGEPCDVYGRREGGQLAVALAARRPESVRRLLLVSTHRYQNDRKRLPEYAQRVLRHMEADPLGGTASCWVQEYPGIVPSVALEAARRQLEAVPSEVGHAQDSVFDGLDLRDLGANCHAPALFLSQEHEIESLTLEAAGCLPCARVASWNQLGDGTINGAEWRRAWDEAFPMALTCRANESVHPSQNYGLSPRETEILGLVCRGLSNAEIADGLVIAPSTAKRHVANVFSKLGVASRPQAIVLAYEQGLFPAPGRRE